MSTYFDYEDLLSLQSIENKTLSGVIYHNWVNQSRAEETFEFLDKLELRFSNGTKIILAASEEMPPGIYVERDFDQEKDNLLLLHQFGGKIILQSEEMTENDLWSPVLGKKLLRVGVVDEGDNCYMNDAIILDFGEDKMEIRPGVEGLVAEPYEED